MSRSNADLQKQQNDAAREVIAALENCSLPRAIWHLNAFERWQVVRDTLLGHAPFRGGLRPRDLPIDRDCREMLRSVAEFHTKGPDSRRGGPSIEYRFGDWLYAFSVLVQPLLREDGDADAPPVAHQAVYQCFREIRRVLPRRVAGADDSDIAEDPDAGEFAKTCPVLHRLIGAVGWSIKDWHYIHAHSPKFDPRSPSGKRIVANCAAIARLAARVTSGQVDIEQPSGNERKLLAQLQKPDLRLMTAMTKSVQDYICRGQRHWLMRGASAFSAQALAFVRDTISDQQKDSLLLSDSDVVVSFLVPADTGLDACQVMADMWTKWREKEEFLSRFPRLREVSEVNTLESLDPTLAFPAISIRISEPLSLFDLCRPRQPQHDGEEQRIQSEAIRGGQGYANKPAARACTYVAGDAAITSRPPAWLEERGNNDGMSKAERNDEAFGFTSLVWSLCGTTLKAHWFQNMSRDNRVINLVPGLRMMPVHHGEWLKWLYAETEPLVFLKLDGDEVGKAFSNSPIPRRPYLSMELGRLVLERVDNATRAVIGQRVALTDDRCREMDDTERTRARNENVPIEGGTIPLPADMVYVGGDDIFFCLPERSVATFLAGFSGPVTDGYPEQWNTLRFKFVSVTLPSPIINQEAISEEPQFDPGTREMRIHPKSRLMQNANLWASHLAGDTLKEVAKADRSEQPKVLEGLKAGWTDTYGFDCEIWEPDLIPHAGAIDGSVVHGVHVRLTSKPL